MKVVCNTDVFDSVTKGKVYDVFIENRQYKIVDDYGDIDLYSKVWFNEYKSEPLVCGNCQGSGEGRYEGTSCYVCKGKGEVIYED